jgi:putative hydrolase of the HAD superfamily
MITAAFSHVRAWVFDLDNTMYPPAARLFDQIEARMTDYVQAALGVDRAQANLLRDQYWAEHGTTLAGLMTLHDIDPGPYLTTVHEIDLSHLQPDPALAAAIAALPGRRIVYTNGSAPYAQRVLAARGLTEAFDAVYGIEHAGFHAKPKQAAFEAVFALDGLGAAHGAMFEDVARNLAAPHAMGMRTVLVGPEPDPADHIHYHTTDLTDFLSQVV